jgi:hypothetical protein
VGYEQDAEAHKLVVAECARLNAELEAANAEKDRLCGTFSCVWVSVSQVFLTSVLYDTHL